MTTLTQARTALAAALSTVAGVTVHSRGAVPDPRHGDGWVTVGPATDGQMWRSADVKLSAIVVVGPDEATAEQAIDDLTIPLLLASDLDDVPTSDRTVQPQLVTVGTNAAPLYALIVSVSVQITTEE